MPTTTLRSLRRFDFDEDVTFVRADAHRPLLLMNVGVAAVHAVDVDRMDTTRIDLSPLADEFLIHEWLVDRDGRCSLLFSSDPLRFGIGIDHERLTPFRLPLPADFPRLANVCWTVPTLRLIDVHGRVWTSGDDALVIASDEMQRQEPQRGEASLARRYALLSHDWETGDVCILDGESNEVGAVVRATGEMAVVDGTGAEIGAAYHRGAMYVCRSDGVDVVADGRRRPLWRPDPAMRTFGIELGPWHGGSYLAVASGSMRSGARPRSVVEIYALPS